MLKHIASVLIAISLFSSHALAEKLVLSTVSWEPIYGKDLPENGFFSALAKEAFKRAGYDMEIKFLPWKRALESARSGKFDGLLGAYYSEDRANTFYYPDHLYSSDEVFVQNKGRGITYKNVEELKRYSVGGMRGGAQMEELRALGISVDETVDDAQSLKKLHSDRIDLVLMGRSQLNYKLANDKDFMKLKDKFEIIEPPFKSFKLYCPITKKRTDGQQIVDKFNAALKSMKADGTYAAILKRFGQN